MASGADDPLAHTTARLSISQAEADGEATARAQLRQFSADARRDSVVLFEDDATADVGLAKRRRRSLAQSTAPVKKERLHKRKLHKINAVPAFRLAVPTKKHPLLPITVMQLRDLALYALNPHNNSVPYWCDVVKRDEIERVVVVVVPGIEELDFVPTETGMTGSEPKPDEASVHLSLSSLQRQPELDFFYSTFEHLLRTRCPGSKDSIYSPLHALTHSPYSAKEKRKLIEDLKSKKLTLWDLFLNELQLVKFGYPSHDADSEGTEDSDYSSDSGTYLSTRKFEHSGSRTFAIDCEFCKAGNTSVLTRISVVNFQGETVLDKFVRPAEEITDYVTRYSGVTAAKLEGVTTTLQDIQREVLALVSSEDILIGHLLELDLNVLQIAHPRIVDTAVVFEHPRGPPARPSLKWLAEKYLGRQIQQGELDALGHSLVEDALACLDLVKKKLQEGPCFGRNMTEITVWERLSRSLGQSVQLLMVDCGGTADAADPNVRVYKTANDDDAIDVLATDVGAHKLTVVRLRELEFARGWSTPPASFVPRAPRGPDSVAAAAAATTVAPPDVSPPLSALNTRLAKLYANLPPRTGLVVTSSQGDPRQMLALQRVRREFQNAERAGAAAPSATWDFDESLKLHAATVRARAAISFMTVKVDTQTPSPE